MKNKSNVGWYVLGGIVAVIVFISLSGISWVIGYNNNVVRAKADISTQWSNIETEYQRRADIYYNMVEVTKGYVKYESSTLEAIIKARSGAFGNSKSESEETMSATESAFARLLLLWEQYPNLKGLELFNQNMAELRNTENRVQIARTDYNSIVRNYNIYISTFPNSILTGMFGNVKESFFEAEKGTEKSPKISYE
jgi:LemA protein